MPLEPMRQGNIVDFEESCSIEMLDRKPDPLVPSRADISLVESGSRPLRRPDCSDSPSLGRHLIEVPQRGLPAWCLNVRRCAPKRVLRAKF